MIEKNGVGEGLGTGLPNDVDYNDTELRMLEFYAKEDAYLQQQEDQAREDEMNREWWS